ncbi:helix-turn-helix domain-containing protein [Arachidicoccus soli]|uniref:AraC family transcriptional regulator n=1 Tax=Arachidicoccus soli TaxID=2341117 RepID=A0A386HSM6_9BACT|nr:AraC family transcriptional regulator [Arachidicoccus soli]AYD48461.1 AraC family transcriptional regulator [Arachidicoccus soli]
MEDFTLQDDKRSKIAILPGLPREEIKIYGLPGAEQRHAYYGDKPMLFQAIRCGKYEIAISDYLVNNRRKVICHANTTCLELHFILKGKALFNLKDLGWQQLDELHHNMIALSKVKNEVFFEIIPVSTFDIHFTIQEVERLAKQYPQLQPLLYALKTGDYASLFALVQKTTPRMLHLIVKIMEALKAGAASNKETIEMIEALVLMVLENKTLKTRYHYNYDFIENVHKSALRIEQHFDEKDVIANQIKQRNLKPDKFREIFRILYGCLPNQYLQKVRVEKANWLIKEHRVSKLDDIAALCAYQSIRQLSNAYYKKYNTTISKAVALAKRGK